MLLPAGRNTLFPSGQGPPCHSGLGYHATQGWATMPLSLLDPGFCSPEGEGGMGGGRGREEAEPVFLSGPTKKHRLTSWVLRCFFFFCLNSLVPDEGLSTAPLQFGYSSERRSILSSSTSNTKVAPPAGERWE